MKSTGYLQRSSSRYASICSTRQQTGAWRIALFTLLLVIGIASVSFGQVSSSSTVRGEVKDPKGAVVPNATVTLTNSQRGDSRQVKSNSDGSYVFTAVDPGEYIVKVEATGFKTTEQTGIAVSPSQTRSVDLVLEIGVASETVTVTQEAAPLQTETGERSNTITAQQIENLSIVGRSSLELLRVLPGVVSPNDPSAYELVTFGGGANATAQYNVNGLRGEANNVSIDGSRLMDIGANNGTIITPNNDMVQQVEVKSSNYAAEYGSSGVQINAVTKSGGKDFHGSVYDYIRPYQIQGNDRSNSIAGVTRPKSSFKYPGGNIGGPVLLPFTNFNRNRDKLFFFFGLEFQRQVQDPGTRRGVVPTLKQRQGDFSEFLPGGPLAGTLNQGGQLNIPSGHPGAGGPAAGNIITPYSDQLGKVLLNLYPLPNYSDPEHRYNYASTVLQPTNRVDMKGRFDYRVSDNTSIYLRLARETEAGDQAYGLWWGPSNYELPSHIKATNLGRSAAVGITSVLSPSMTNEVVFSASKLKLDNDYADPNKLSRAALGLSNYKLPFNDASPYVPLAIVTQAWDDNEAAASNQPGLFYEPPGLPLFAHNSSYSVTDNLSKVWGAHTIKFGGLIEQANKIQNQSYNQDGQIILTNWGNGGTGNMFGDLFTGNATQFNKSSASAVGHFRFYNVEAYAQDSWKVRPNITLEYGLRAAYFPTNYELNGLGVIFSPSAYNPAQGAFINGDPAKPNGLLIAANGQVDKKLIPNPSVQFAPRLNVAWDIGGKGDLVLRGGAGLFYSRVQGNYQYGILGLPPNSYNAGYDSGANCTPLLSCAASINPLSLASFTISSQDPEDKHVPRIASMSLSVAKRLPFKNVLEVAYVGTLGRHLPENIDINPIRPTFSGTLGNANLADPQQRAALFQANPQALLNTLRRFPTLARVNYAQYTGTSSYNSLQATLSRQLGQKLQYFLTYTFSKALGTTSVNETGSDVDPIDTRGRSYGILPFDRTHVLNLSYNYYLPNGGRGALNNWLGRGLLNGWQLSGITTYSSGPPLRVTVNGDFSQGYIRAAYLGTSSTGNATGLAALPVNIISNPNTGNTGLGQQLLDPAAFAIPPFAVNNSGPFQSPFYMRAPSRTNFDVSAFKSFKFDETRSLEFRAGFFNIFNSAFADPNRGDIDTTLQTKCRANLPAGIPNGTGVTAAGNNVCDPTKGFDILSSTFGKITNKHGHRVIELALKFYF
jgi:hypothetical protein